MISDLRVDGPSSITDPPKEVQANLYVDLARVLQLADEDGVSTSNGMSVGYDLKALPNTSSSIQFEGYSSNITAGASIIGATSAVVKSLNNGDLSVGEEITIYDDVVSFRVTVTSVDEVSKTIGFTPIPSAVKANALICRSSVERYAGGASMAGWHNSKDYGAVWGSSVLPTTNIPSTSNSIAVHPNGNFVAAGIGTGVFYVFSYNPQTGVLGARTNTDVSVGTDVRDIAFTNDGLALVMVNNTSPYIHVFEFNPATGAVGAKYTAPSVTAPPGANAMGKDPNNPMFLVGGSGSASAVFQVDTALKVTTRMAVFSTSVGSVNGLAVNANSTKVAVVGSASPYIRVFDYSVSGGVVNITGASAPGNSGTFYTGSHAGVAFHPTGMVLYVTSTINGNIRGYPITEDGTVLWDNSYTATITGGGTSSRIAVHPNKPILAVVQQGSSSPYIFLVKVPLSRLDTTSPNFTVLTGPAAQSGGGSLPRGVAFSPAGDSVLITGNSSPYMRINTVNLYTKHVLQEDMRYSVNTDQNNMTGYIDMADDPDVTLTIAISAVAPGATELYSNVPYTSSIVRGIRKITFSAALANIGRVSMRLTLSRTNVNSTAIIQNIITIPM